MPGLIVYLDYGVEFPNRLGNHPGLIVYVDYILHSLILGNLQPGPPRTGAPIHQYTCANRGVGVQVQGRSSIPSRHSYPNPQHWRLNRMAAGATLLTAR